MCDLMQVWEIDERVSVFVWTVLGFLCGSLPFSAWIARLALGTDLRRVGDGNPGAANVFRAGGRGWTLVALVLDFGKGAVPVGTAQWAGAEEWQLVPVALAPVLGHAFSPLLGLRGGKALAVTFGVWTGLTLWQGPVLLGLGFIAGIALIRNDAWSVALGMLTLLPLGPLMGRPELLVIWLCNWLLLLYKHREGLASGLRPRRWLARLLGVEEGNANVR